MFDRRVHKLVMIRILRAIYSEVELRGKLAFKGGTMAMMFYDLPRMSVDLDFDLLDEAMVGLVMERFNKLLPKYGKVIEAVDKKYTIFYLVDYGYSERKLKIEISKRKKETKYVIGNYLGIPMLIINRSAMVACKLMALINRTHEANRDVFDMWYFLKNGMEVDKELFEMETGISLTEGWEKAKNRISGLKKNELLFGLGDLLDNSMKETVKKQMVDDLKWEIEARLAMK